MSYIYLRTQTGPSLYTVGFYGPSGQWISDSDHETADAAAARVNYLNGGAAPNPSQVECPNCSYTFSMRRKHP